MAENDSTLKIILLTGYLGAGKTTLLNHILTNDQGLRAAVIVNDIGEVNIDAELLGSGTVDETTSVMPLTNGCICCTLSDDLAQQLGKIVDSGKYDYIAIEASGICEPMPIAYTISEFCNVANARGALVSLDNIVAVVDCARMVEEFETGHRLDTHDYDNDDVEALIVEQLEFCTTVLLNKTDLVSDEQLAETKALIRNLQKDAKIIECEQGMAPLEELLDTGRFDFDSAYRSAAWLDTFAHGEHAHSHHHGCSCGHDHDEECSCHDGAGGEMLEYGFSTFVYERNAAFGEEAFASFVSDWPQEVIRTKGFVWIAPYPETQFILEQAGSQRGLVDNGTFGAAGPSTKLVFIGRNMNREAIEHRLDACLAD